MINLIAKFTVKPAYVDTFKAALKLNKKGALKEAGCLQMDLFVDVKEGNTFFVYERWADEAALDFHKKQTYTQALVEIAESALQVVPEFLKLGTTMPLPIPAKSPNAEDELCIIFFIFKFDGAYRERLLKQFENHIENTRKEEANLLFDLYTIEGSNDILAVYEHWRNEAAIWDIHFKQPYSEVTGALLKEALIGDMEQYMNFVTEITV